MNCLFRDHYGESDSMTRRTQIVVGGEGAHAWLKEIASTNEPTWWSCSKRTKKGDSLFFYAMKPTSAIVATAIASSNAKANKRWHYVAGIEHVKLLGRPLTREELLDKIPEWGWPQQPRKSTYPEEAVVRKLQRLTKLKGTQPPIRINIVGGGFGSATENRIVEKAACKAVQKHLQRNGYAVVSQESEKVGYDFDARRNGEELHVEVKGVSGSVRKFIITAREVRRARGDSKFRLALVTDAIVSDRRIRICTRKEFLESFELNPIAYFAEYNIGSLP